EGDCEESDEEVGTTADESVEQSSSDEEFQLPPEMLKTSSGRIVKKVEYLERSYSEEDRQTRKKTHIENDEVYNSEYRYPKRTRSNNTGAQIQRVVTMSLRETDNRTRNALRAFEPLVSEAMRQQFSWPFLKPVDAKVVPDYYQVFVVIFCTAAS
ncbi:unnamed protein product, partial [Gongylonema pulchrum]|uniref:DDE_Tnp_1_7 domain-containing protein n=1 Tax=Gongylonema pulchrum TaxID=637853 RepID=A0A183DAH3_9BILA